MFDNQVRERYRYLAKEWGVTPKIVDQASVLAFKDDTETRSQEEYETLMKTHVELLRPKIKTKLRKGTGRKPKVILIGTPASENIGANL